MQSIKYDYLLLFSGHKVCMQFNNKDKWLFKVFAKENEESSTDLKTGTVPPDDVI